MADSPEQEKGTAWVLTPISIRLSQGKRKTSPYWERSNPGIVPGLTWWKIAFTARALLMIRAPSLHSDCREGHQDKWGPSPRGKAFDYMHQKQDDLVMAAKIYAAVALEICSTEKSERK